ncbi:MAG: hypothetical protein ACLQQ4_12185 [Bacteroidia bacterium]
MEILNEIRAIKAKERLNNDILANIWKCKRQQVSRMLNGHADISIERFEQLLTEYGYILNIEKKGRKY